MFQYWKYMRILESISQYPIIFQRMQKKLLFSKPG